MGSYSGQPDVNAALAGAFFQRDALCVAAQGFKVETFPRVMASAASVMVGGTVYVTGVGLLRGEIVSNITILLTSPTASGMTLSKVGLLDLAGNRLALSADQGTAWQTASLKTCAMIAPYTVPVSGMYYVAVVAAASVTLPSIGRSAITAAAEGMPGFSFPHASMLSQTDIPSAVTLQVASGVQLAMWAGVS